MDSDNQASSSSKMTPNSCWVCKSNFPNKASLSNHFEDEFHKTNCTKVCQELTMDFGNPTKDLVTSMKIDPSKHVPGAEEVFEYRFGPKLDRAFFLCQLCVTIPLSRERMKSHLEGRKHLLNHMLKFKPTMHEKMIGLEKRDKSLFVAKIKQYATQNEEEGGIKAISVKVNPNITDEDINKFKQSCGQPNKNEENLEEEREENKGNPQVDSERQISNTEKSDGAEVFCKVCDKTFVNKEDLFVHNTTDDHYQKIGNVLKVIKPETEQTASVKEENKDNSGKDERKKEEKSFDKKEKKDSSLLPTPKMGLLGHRPKKSNRRSRSSERSREDYNKLEDYYKERSRKEKNRERSNTTNSKSRGRNEKGNPNRKRGILGSPPRESSTKNVPSIFDIDPLQINNQPSQQQPQRMNQIGLMGMNPMGANQISPMQLQNQRLQMQKLINQRQLQGAMNQGMMNQTPMQNVLTQKVQMQAMENQRQMQMLANQQTQMMTARNQNQMQANHAQLQNMAGHFSQQAFIQTPGRSYGPNTMQGSFNLNNSGNTPKVKSLLDMDIGDGPSERKRSRFDSQKEVPKASRSRDRRRRSSSPRSKKGLLGDIPRGTLLPYPDDKDRRNYDEHDMYLAELELEKDIQRRTREVSKPKSLLGNPPTGEVSKKRSSKWEGSSNSKPTLLDDRDIYYSCQRSSTGNYYTPLGSTSQFSAANSSTSSYNQPYNEDGDRYVDPNDEGAILKALQKAQEKKKPKLIDATDEEALLVALEKVRQSKQESRPSSEDYYGTRSSYLSKTAYPFQSSQSYGILETKKSVPSLLGDSPKSSSASFPSTNHPSTFYSSKQPFRSYYH